jgi:hypothetical protein
MSTLSISEKEKQSSTKNEPTPSGVATLADLSGYTVFPCYGSNDPERYKRPKLTGGLYSNTLIYPHIIKTDIEGRGWEDVIPAICCWNVLVVDVDNHPNEKGETGVESFGRMVEELGLDIACLGANVATPSGGYQFYFRIPRNFLFLVNSTDITDHRGIKVKIDIKGFGSYVIAPYSKGIDTKNQIGNAGEYLPTFIDEQTHLLTRPEALPEIPPQLLALLQTDSEKPYKKLTPEKIALTKKTMELLTQLYGDEAELPDISRLVVAGDSVESVDVINISSDQLETKTETPVEETETTDEETALTPPETPLEGGEDETETEAEEEEETPLEANTGAEDDLLDGLDPDIQESIRRMKTPLPLDSVSISYITVFGSQVKGKIRLQERLNPILFHSMIVAPSSGGKGNLLDTVTYALQRLQNQKNKEYGVKLKLWKKQQAAKGRKKAVASAVDTPVEKVGTVDGENVENKPLEMTPPAAPAPQTTEPPMMEEPIREHYIHSQGQTVQGVKAALTEMEEGNQKGGLCLAIGEGAVFLGGMNQFSRGSSDFPDMADIMKGGPVDPLFKSTYYHCAEPNIGVCLVIQPEILAEFLNHRKDQVLLGFFSRFFYNVVPPRKHHLPVTDGELINDPDVETYEQKLLEMLLNDSTPYLVLSPEAFTLYEKHAAEVDDIMNEKQGSRDITDRFIYSMAGHSMDWVRSVAGIAHYLNQAALKIRGESDRLSNVITEAEMVFAVRFYQHYRAQFLPYLMGLNLESTKHKDAKKICRRITNLASTQSKKVNWNEVRNGVDVIKGRLKSRYADEMLEYLREAQLIEIERVQNPTNHKTSILVSLTRAGANMGRS